MCDLIQFRSQLAELGFQGSHSGRERVRLAQLSSLASASWCLRVRYSLVCPRQCCQLDEVVHPLLEGDNLGFWMWLRLLHSSRLLCCALLLSLSLYLRQSLGALSRGHPLSTRIPFRLQLSQLHPPRLSCAVLLLTQTLCLCLLRLTDSVDEPCVRCVARHLCCLALFFRSIAFPVIAALPKRVKSLEHFCVLLNCFLLSLMDFVLFTCLYVERVPLVLLYCLLLLQHLYFNFLNFVALLHLRLPFALLCLFYSRDTLGHAF